ncbi:MULTISPECIES: DUF2510 domain-containing protein [unclassified Mycolicibacterium]|uniref:DUF2510 domain-containing protein n=1 Tax=unclassified Mycolicibacterium TaxID=2636767 RepID=UPI001391D2D2|nr:MULTISPECIES: DUF2510 domain-containing protein [unclassified Mycolicibacterium]
MCVIGSPDVPDDQPAWLTDPWNPGQLRYYDGREWTGSVAARQGVPVEHFPVQPAHNPNREFPLGQRILHVRALPQRADIDVACLIEDDHGQMLAEIRPTSTVLQRKSAAHRFGVLDPRGIPMGFFTRAAGVGVRDSIGVTDASDRTVGRLRRTNNFWQRLRSSAIDMTLECDQQTVGHTRVSISPRARFTKVDEPIYDMTGAVVATVRRQWRYVDTSVTFYDYTLECPQPTIHPLPELILATAFGHYLYDRLEVGGPFASHTNFH